MHKRNMIDKFSDIHETNLKQISIKDMIGSIYVWKDKENLFV